MTLDVSEGGRLDWDELGQAFTTVAAARCCASLRVAIFHRAQDSDGGRACRVTDLIAHVDAEHCPRAPIRA